MYKINNIIYKKFGNKLDNRYFKSVFNLCFNVYNQKSIIKKASKMHYMKRSLQEKGWGNDYNVFLKREFYLNFYVNNKHSIPQEEEEAKLFIKENLKKYIKKRNPETVFTTKLMDLYTEKSLPFDFSIKEIEEGFDNYLKRKELKYSKKDNPHITALDDEPISYVVNYFIMQQTRSPIGIYQLMNQFITNKNQKIEINMAYYFREQYNNFIPELFKFYYKKYYYKGARCQVININISSNILSYSNLVTFGEINCINLYDYNLLYPNQKLNNYIEIIKKIDVAAISGKKLYFLIKDYDVNNDVVYKTIANIIGNSWNIFSFLNSYQYLVCPSASDKSNFLDYLAMMTYDMHKLNYWDYFYNLHFYEEKLIELEKFIY